MKKMLYIYMVKYYSAIKRNKMLPFTATCSPWMDLENIKLSKISQKVKTE